MSTGGAERAAEILLAAHDTEARLISPLRARRFDLLLHLIANLGQPLAVCGPEGSGKTTFLHLLGEQALENWRVVPLDTSARLTAQQAQDAILTALDGGDPDAPRDLEALLAELARGSQLAVIVLDDAGRLPPLTLAELHRLARRFPALRLVLALRPEEVRARASTNAGLFDDCHFIEVPLLDEAQCGHFLQQLAHTPPRLLGQGDITPDFIARAFRDSGGIPGRILQLLSVPAGKKRAISFGGEFVWLGVLGTSFAVALLVTAWIWHGRAVKTEPPVVGEAPPSPVSETPAAPAEAISPAPEAGPEPPAPLVSPPVSESAQPSPQPLSEGKPAEPVPPPSSAAVTSPLATSGGETQRPPAPPTPPPESGAEPVVAIPPPEPLQKAAETPKEKPAEPALTAATPAEHAAESANHNPAKEPKAKEPKKESQANPPQSAAQGQPGAKMSLPAGVSGPDWLVAQDAAAWSLQIMSARDPASIAALQKRYPGLKGLSAYRVTRKGKALYPVLYGLFPNEEEARHAAAQLPESLDKAAPRRLGDIQRDVGAGIKAK